MVTTQETNDEGVPVKVIKRYANRKLYDTERSCYVTLDEIAQMIKEGEEVRVVDNKTKEDLSAVTLAQIIVEEEKKVARMPLKLLRGIIRSSNDALGDFYQRHLADPAKSFRDDVERRVDTMLHKDNGDDGTPIAGTVSAGAPAPAVESAPQDGDGAGEDKQRPASEENPVRAFVTATTEAFENLQRVVDDRVKVALSRMTHLSAARGEMERLKKRVKGMEDKLAQMERPED